MDLIGKRLSWDERKKHHIYISGPDFPEQKTSLFDELEISLRYHNFNPDLKYRYDVFFFHPMINVYQLNPYIHSYY